MESTYVSLSENRVMRIQYFLKPKLSKDEFAETIKPNARPPYYGRYAIYKTDLLRSMDSDAKVSTQLTGADISVLTRTILELTENDIKMDFQEAYDYYFG